MNKVNTSRLRGIAPIDLCVSSCLRSRCTASGCSTLTSGWQTRKDGFAYRSLLSIVRFGLGERWRVDGGVGCRMGRLKMEAVVSRLAFEAVSLYRLYRQCLRVPP
jgi:hypothetical protein